MEAPAAAPADAEDGTAAESVVLYTLLDCGGELDAIEHDGDVHNMQFIPTSQPVPAHQVPAARPSSCLNRIFGRHTSAEPMPQVLLRQRLRLV